MSARILRGHTVASHLSVMNRAMRAMEPVPAVADLGVELPNTDLVEDLDAELESHQ